MSSVQEVNAYNRGKREGYDIGYTAGSTDMRARAIKEGTSLRIFKLIIAGVIGFMAAIGVQAHAEATAQTSVTVVIGAEVACNPKNCPETWEEEPVVVENVDNSTPSWWERMLQWTQNLFM